jgi:hypothetical protein
MQAKSSFAWEMLEYFCFDPYSSKKDFPKRHGEPPPTNSLLFQGIDAQICSLYKSQSLV